MYVPTFQRVSPPVGDPPGREKTKVIAMPATQAVAILIFISLSLNQALFNRLYLIGIFAGIPQELRNIFWQGLAIK